MDCTTTGVTKPECFPAEAFCTFETSGSTGTPKRIVKSRDTLLREVALHHARLADALAQKPAFLSTIEAHHLYGMLWRTLLPQRAGCPHTDEVLFAPETLIARMRVEKRVFLVTTPSFLAHFTAYADQYDVPQNAIGIVTSGARLTPDVAAAARRLFGCAPLEIFGSTETGGVAWRQLGKGCYPLWEAFEPVSLATTAQTHQLVVTSPYSFVQTPWTMGDAVRLESDTRHFTLLGRVDRIVKLAERQVSLTALETQSLELPEIREIVFVPIEGVHGLLLGAVVVLTRFPADAALAARHLRARLSKLLSVGCVPRKYRFVRAIPRNAQGKVLMRGLEVLFGKTYVYPKSSSCFAGHFPGRPVLPGVVLVHDAACAVQALLGSLVRVKAVRKMKFLSPVLPDERIVLTLDWQDALGCSYVWKKAATQAVCACGTFVLVREA